MNKFWLLIFLASANICLGQEVTALAEMPEAVSNNAVTLAEVNGQQYLYSFAGIDETKMFDGIHKRCFRYDLASDQWESIPDLPNGGGRIAAGASTVKNKIYVFGGYEVFEDGTEKSFTLGHVFDPSINDFLPDAAPIPVPIDDHVQAVYKDSLIFLVTGWSDDDNVPNVQIYDTSTDSWQVGTPTPDNSSYKAFGASGCIVGDTLYYSGGVRIGAGSFIMATTFRKAYINPFDPTDLTWYLDNVFSSKGYRMAAGVLYERKPVWIGGSDIAYNYDGLAYANGEGVEPMERILVYQPSLESFYTNLLDLKLMDLRGLAQVNDHTTIVCGGMLSGQEVSNKTFKIEFSPVSNQEITNEFSLAYPNPSNGEIHLSNSEYEELILLNIRGREIRRFKLVADQSIDLKSIDSGLYYLLFKREGELDAIQKLVISK